MFCTKCGEKLEEGAKFCTNCGETVTEVKEEKKETKKEEPKEEKKETKKEEKKEETKTVDTGVKIDGKPVVVEKPAEDGKATASLVLGICSIVISCLALPLSIVGLILGLVSKERSGKRTAGIVMNAIMLALSVLTLILFGAFAAMGYSIIDEFEKDFESEWNEVVDDDNNNNNSKVVEDDGTKYVGDSSYGYVKVPEKWYKFVDVDGNSSLQYTDIGDKGYIVTLNVIQQDVSVEDATKAITEGVKGEGASAYYYTATIGKYKGYVIRAYYSDGTYLDSYIFKTEDDVLRFVSIEGPNKYSDEFDIPKTFTLTK